MVAAEARAQVAVHAALLLFTCYALLWCAVVA